VLRVLAVTNEWPTAARPWRAPFVADQVEALRRRGVVVDVFAFRGAKNPLRYAAAAWRLRQKIACRYDLVHAHFGQSGLICLSRALPMVVTLRGTDPIGIAGPRGGYTVRGTVLRWACRLVAQRADKIIAVSTNLTRYVSRRDIEIIPDGVDLALFRPMPQDEARRILTLPATRPLVLFPYAPSNPVKRFGLAREAVRRTELSDVELVALGTVPHKDMPLYMNACDALIMTSLHEGSPNVVKEALACGLPVVSLDVGDVSERITSVEGCRLCPDDHPESIGMALREVLRQRVRVDARTQLADITLNRTTERVVDVYRAAIADWRSRRVGVQRPATTTIC